MRVLIDGYNVMHAAGRMNRRFGPDGLRRTRHRFLNELADALGADESREATIVFDASSLPLNQRPESSHKGITVIYAIEDEDADSRIERLIAGDSAPRSLTVVSTDRRIRRAAERRRATAMTADDFLDYLDDRRRSRLDRASGSPCEPDRLRLEGPCPDEVGRWLRVFGALDEEPGVDAAYGPGPADWTDADLDRVAREVEEEFRDMARPPAPQKRGR